MLTLWTRTGEILKARLELLDTKKFAEIEAVRRKYLLEDDLEEKLTNRAFLNTSQRR